MVSETAFLPKVLVVEDDGMIRLLLTESLDEAGIGYIEAGSAEEALDVIVDAGRPDVLVTDINLGSGMDGIALSERLRQTYPDLPVVFITGADANLASRAETAIEAHIHKPFAPETMIEVIIAMTAPAMAKAA